MPIQGFLTDKILDSSVKDRVNGGEKADWLWGGLGNIMGIDSEGIVDDAYATGQKTEADRVIAGSGFSRNELSKYGDLSTPEGVKGATAEASRARNLSDSQTQHTRSLEPLTAQLASAEKGRNAELELSRLQFQQTSEQNRNQFQIQMEQLRNDRADAKEQRADELEYRRMQDRKEDLRYNENLERMDRKDRQASINTLVQGLAALGAAFAA